jgi:hypothetical protein
MFPFMCSRLNVKDMQRSRGYESRKLGNSLLIPTQIHTTVGDLFQEDSRGSANESEELLEACHIAPRAALGWRTGGGAQCYTGIIVIVIKSRESPLAAISTLIRPGFQAHIGCAAEWSNNGIQGMVR